MVWVRERFGPERVSERRACRVLGQARTTQRRVRQIPEDEAQLVARMVGLAGSIRAIRLPEDYGDASLGGVEGEPQEGPKAVEAGRAESPVETTETKEAVVA